MTERTRRSLFRTSSSLLAGVILAGCTNLVSTSGETTAPETTTDEPTRTTTGTRTETAMGTGRTTTTTDEPTENGTSELGKSTDSLKIWEIAANPKGQDSKHLNREIVTLEAQGTEPIDATGYTLEYGTGRTYTFPKLTSDLPRGTTIEIHSGPGENGVDASAPPQYALFVGSETPLLNNDGRTLVLRKPNGAIVQKVSYPALNEGVPYVVPTPPATVTPRDDTARPTAKPTKTTSLNCDQIDQNKIEVQPVDLPSTLESSANPIRFEKLSPAERTMVKKAIRRGVYRECPSSSKEAWLSFYSRVSQRCAQSESGIAYLKRQNSYYRVSVRMQDSRTCG